MQHKKSVPQKNSSILENKLFLNSVLILAVLFLINANLVMLFTIVRGMTSGFVPSSTYATTTTEDKKWKNKNIASGICKYDECFQDGSYVINGENENFLAGCNTPGLEDPEKKCIMKLFDSKIYVAPLATQTKWSMPNVKWDCSEVEGSACDYCSTLTVGWMKWELPHYALWGLQDVFNNKSKIMGILPEWYWSSTFYWFDGKDARWFMRSMESWDSTRNWSEELAQVRCVAK